MDILVFTYALNGFLMIAFPVGLAVYLTSRWRQSWSIWWIGAGTFILSQVVHIPFNWGVGLLLNRTGMVYWSSLGQAIFNSIFLGLSAGLFEESARYFILRVWGKSIRSWRRGIVFGAGHGGMEAILFGLIALFGFVQLLILRQATPDQLVRLVGAEKIALVQAQLATAWTTPWYLTLLGAVERLFTIPVQIFLAVLVLQAVLRKQVRWLFFAILFHAIVDGLVVFLPPYMNVLIIEGIIGLFAVVSVLATWHFRQTNPVDVPEIILPPLEQIPLKPVDESNENLENSRYLG